MSMFELRAKLTFQPGKPPSVLAEVVRRLLNLSLILNQTPCSTLKHRHILGEYFLKESWANKIKVSPDSKANVFPNLGEWDISWLERLPLLLEFVRKADAPTLLGDAVPHFLGDIPAHEVSCAFFTPLLSHFLQNGLQNWGCGITFACK